MRWPGVARPRAASSAARTRRPYGWPGRRPDRAGRLGRVRWPGCGWPVGVEQGAQGGRDLGQRRLVEAAQPAVAAPGDVAAGWGEHAAADAAPVDVGEASGWAVAQPGRGEPVVPATAPRGHQRTGEPQVHRPCELPEGGQAGGAVDVEGVEDDAGGQAEVGLGPALPPALELGRVGGGVVDAVADQGMLGRPVTRGPRRQEQARLAPPRSGAGPVDRVDGDAAGGVTQGGVQQRVHATRLLSVGRCGWLVGLPGGLLLGLDGGLDGQLGEPAHHRGGAPQRASLESAAGAWRSPIRPRRTGR